MAFVPNSSQQCKLFDPFYGLTPREKKYLENSWAKDFYRLIFSSINEERFECLYSSNPASRPNTPVNVTFGALLLKELFNLTDIELRERMMFDVLFQYALGTTSFEEQPVSDRTFSRFREKLYNHMVETGQDLVQEEMYALTDAFAAFSGINTSIRRMDSLMVASNCKKMSRLELIYTCQANMIKKLKKEGKTIPDRQKHYLEEDDVNDIIYHQRNQDLDTRLQNVIDDAVEIGEMIPQDLQDSQEYHLLQRVLEEQTEETDTGRRLKDHEQIRSDSLQNPSDPDATYRKKAGKGHIGYVANVVETCPEEEGSSYITHYDLKPNIHSDQAFGHEIIETLGQDDEKLTLIADGAYDSYALKNKAKDHNIKLVTTSLVGKTPDPTISHYKLDTETKEVLTCPAGKTPIKTSYYEKSGTYRAIFNKSACKNCPHAKKCGMKKQLKTNVVTITEKMVSRAKQVIEMGSQAYKKLAKKRNAIEGIPSILRRRYGIDNLPVRGLVRSKIWLGFKIGAINAKRLIKSLELNPI